MSDPFQGATCVVTGAASGIGRSLTLALLRRGADVYAADRDAAGLAALRDSSPPGLTTRVVDVSSRTDVAALLADAVDSGGCLDYLFNNAGIVVGGPFEHLDDEAWARIVDVNLWGVVHGTQLGYAQMLRQGSGHIVNTASSAGVMPVAKSVAYATTKHAVVGLSDSLRGEARHRGIKVSAVIPGIVDTGIFDSAHNVGGHDYAAAMDKVPFRKITPDRAADAILAGVARNAAHITFPFYNRALVTLYRLAPAAIGRLVNP
jgi:short-subunit dehydrogenase